MRRILVAAAALSMVLLASMVWGRHYYNEPPPEVVGSDTRRERPPLEDCTTGILDPLQPARWSVTEEARVYEVVITRELLSHRPFLGEGSWHPSMIVIDPRALRPRLPPWHADPWPMNDLCRAHALRHDTATSFRWMNRAPDAGIFKLFSLRVPTKVGPLPQVPNGVFPAGAIYIRLSRVGFSVDFQQALVFMDVHPTLGFGYGTIFILERDRGRWKVRDRIPGWIA